MATEPQHRDLGSPREMRVSPHVGTIVEPGPGRIDMTKFDNVVDGSAIDGRTGNFLFTVGGVASGKSTLQNFLIHRLHVDENIHFDRTSRDGKTASEAYLNAWVHNIAAGYLPERTQKGVLREFNVRFGQRGRPKLDFSFIEIAGEDIRSIVPTADQKQPKLNDHLERYLRLGGVNKRFLFISDASRNRLGGICPLVRTLRVPERLEGDVELRREVRQHLDQAGAPKWTVDAKARHAIGDEIQYRDVLRNRFAIVQHQHGNRARRIYRGVVASGLCGLGFKIDPLELG